MRAALMRAQTWTLDGKGLLRGGIDRSLRAASPSSVVEGFDKHSIVADPLFKDPDNGDFSLV